MADFGGIDLDSLTSDPKAALKGDLKAESQQSQKLEGQQKEAVAKYSAETGEIKEKQQALTEEAKKPGGALSPPELTDYKPPPSTNPWEQWGSPAMWLAGLSTFLGRRSLTRALDAGGAYLNAVKVNDQARSKQAFDQWKADTENAIKMHDWQMDAYKEAMQNLRDDKAGAKAEVETIAYAMAHDPMLEALKDGREATLNVYDTMTRHGDELKRMQPELEDLNFRQGMQKKVAAIQAKRDADLRAPGADPHVVNMAATQAINDLTQQADAYFGRSGGRAGSAKGSVTLTPEQIENLYTGKARMSDYGIRGDERAAVLAQVTAAHPDFDTRLYDIRKGVMKGYMDPNGVANKNIVASNTAIGHTAQLRELAQALHNGDNQTVNRLVNEVRTNFGHPEVTTSQMAITAIGEEMMKAFRQVGASEKEAESWQKNLNVPVFGPQQADAATREAMELLMPRLDTLNENWKTDMGTDQDYAGLITPNSKRILEDLDINYPGKSDSPAKGPAPGTIIAGHRFKGGDPNKESNWEVVK